jgi:hypothetical protein
MPRTHKYEAPVLAGAPLKLPQDTMAVIGANMAALEGAQ